MPIDVASSKSPHTSSHTVATIVFGCLIGVTLLTRMTAANIWRADAATDPDAYVGIARTLAAGDGFCTPGTLSPTAYRPPLYPYILATALLGAPNDAPLGMFVAGFNIVSAVLLCGVMWWWGLRLGTWIVAILATAIIACDPLLIRATPLAMTEPCFTLLVAVALFCLIVDRTADEALGHVGAGLFLGLAALCRPTIWPFIGLYSLGLLIMHRRELRSAIRPLGVMWLMIAVVVSPWVIRNQIVFGHPILTTTHGGYTLLLGNNPVFYREVARQPWGTVWDGDSLTRWQHAMLAEMDAALGPDAGEVAQDRWQAARAWQNISADPAGFGWAVWYRVRSLWSLSPRGAAGESVSPLVRTLVALWYAALFGLAVVGAVVWYRERRPGLWVLLLFVASIQAVHLFYWTDTRMRGPLHPVLAVLAAVAVERVFRARRR